MVISDENEPTLEIDFSTIGDVLCKESALVQAAQALDIVTQLAIADGDNDTLIKVAALWSDVADRLETDQKDGGGTSGPPGTDKFTMGFST